MKGRIAIIFALALGLCSCGMPGQAGHDGERREKAPSGARPGRDFRDSESWKGEKAAGVYEGAEPPVFTFLEQITPRDSVLVADQLRYGFVLKDIPEGTPLALPELTLEDDAPLQILGSWQLDSTRVSKRKEKPARYDIKASLKITAWMGGTYALPDLPALVDGDTLVFRAAEPLEVKELPVDMESFQPHDIKPQQKFPYTLAELFPWIWGIGMGLSIIAALILWLVYRQKKTQEAIFNEPAHIRALRKLDKLRGDALWQPSKQKFFYSEATDAIREYMAARYEVGAMEMTTAEIFDALRGKDIPEELRAQMKALFERADFVKFARYTATPEENAQVLPQAVNFVTTTYQEEIEMPGGAGHDEKGAGHDEKEKEG